MAELPPPEPPLPFDAEGPVDWALGKVFFESILKPIMYAVLPDRVDPRDWMRTEPLALTLAPSSTHLANDVQDYWFDFVADTGDSDVAAYSLGYLMHGDLAVADAARVSVDRPELEGPLAISTHDGEPNPAVLPRGQFLFVGGDTAYPVADWRQIYDRFTLPMNHAFDRRFASREKPQPRPLLGIPGNHDWYDNLDGFNRTFRLPTADAVAPTGGVTPSSIPVGYCANQQASYFSLPLKGGWELWALDARDGPDMDLRQRAYFEALPAPRRLLLATPNPAFVDGQRASWFDKLWKVLPAAARQTVALWFSGDTHHYARYERAPLPNQRAITSLVSGLGGAALHAPLRPENPTTAELPHARLHPSVEVAEAAIVDRLRSPLYMVQRPGLRWLGAVLGLCLSGGALQTEGEVAPLLDRIYGVQQPARWQWPLVLLTFGATAFWLARKLTGKKPTETQVRERPRKSRVWALLGPALLLEGVFAGITVFQARTFGSATADLAFELAALALLVGVGRLFHSGVPSEERSVPRMFGLWLTALALGVLTVAGSVVGARGVSSALLHAGWLEGNWLRAGAVLASLAVILGAMVVFPILAGWALAAAFKLGAQRMFVSSFAAVDRFQAFIRFRLRFDPATEQASLTGFVISVSGGVTREQLRAPKADGSDLVPSAEIIDVFTIS